MNRHGPVDLSRYSRQAILKEIGEDGQRRLLASRVAVVGAGATGSTASTILARAGIGFIRLVDRDIVEVSNLQRQLLYIEEDARLGLPKAVAAERHLSSMNPDIVVEGINDHLSPRNISALLGDCDLVVDGTDNMETRYLVNDYCVREGLPWIYGGALGSRGMTMAIDSGAGPCFRCLFREAPGPGELGTCETAGVLGSAPVIVGAHQGAAAIRLLVSGERSAAGKLLTFDLWSDEYTAITVRKDPDCPACGRREFPYLREEIKTTVVTTCGEGTYQIYPPAPRPIDLARHARSLEGKGKVVPKGHYIEFAEEDRGMILFADGRARIKGVSSPAEALSFYARYVGM